MILNLALINLYIFLIMCKIFSCILGFLVSDIDKICGICFKYSYPNTRQDHGLTC